jgi:hypothetical protein
VCFPSPGSTWLWLAAAPVKAPDELAALGLDRRLASPESPDIQAKKNIKHELTQPPIALDTDPPSHGRTTHSLTRSGGKVGIASPSERLLGGTTRQA